MQEKAESNRGKATMKIAISGKGGVGKTTIMALLAEEFKQNGKDVLVIDADPKSSYG